MGDAVVVTTDGDGDDSAAEEVAEVLPEVVEAVGDAVATAVEAATDDEPVAEPVVIETPSPGELADAEAARIQAEADARSQVIAAEAEADIARMEAAARIEEGHEPEGEQPIGEMMGEVFGDDTAEPIDVPDLAPKKGHWFFRPLWGSRR